METDAPVRRFLVPVSRVSSMWRLLATPVATMLLVLGVRTHSNAAEEKR